MIFGMAHNEPIFQQSLPEDIQVKAIRKIEGFEKAKLFRPGYAIEYDYFPPTQLKHSLETKIIENLFFAGQINGTTGYEEAASQGLMAGINAHLKNNNEDAFILQRSEAYIGVLIDDLITKGTEEPYRMFTSRAEFRILLRQDNADFRLTEKGEKLGLVEKTRLDRLSDKSKSFENAKTYLDTQKPDSKEVNKVLAQKNSSQIKDKVSLLQLLKRPEINVSDFIESNLKEAEILRTLNREGLQQAEIQIKYDHYINREKEMAEKLNNLEGLKIPESLNYNNFSSISKEARQKLQELKPATLGQASRISGVSPADISVLMVYLRQ